MSTLGDALVANLKHIIAKKVILVALFRGIGSTSVWLNQIPLDQKNKK